MAPQTIFSIAPAIAIVGIGLSLLLWQTLKNTQDQALQNLLGNSLRSYAKLVSTRVESVERSLGRVGNWWTLLQRTPRLAWANDAKALLADYPVLEEVQWVDSGLVLRWSVSREGESWGLSTQIDERRLVDSNIDRNQRRHVARLTNLTSAADGNLYAEILVPLWVNETFDGLIIGKLNVSRLLYSVYDDAEVVAALDISRDGTVVFSRQNSEIAVGKNLVANHAIQLDGITIGASLRPTTGFLATYDTRWPSIVLGGSLVGTALIAILMHQWLRILMANRNLRLKQAALVGSEAESRGHRVHLETMYNTAPFGVCFFDLSLRYVSVNERLANFNRATVSEHIGHTPREVRPSVADEIEPILKYVLTSGTAVENLEVQGPDPDDPNSRRWWLSSYHPARDEDGKIIGIVASILDIASLKEAESEKEKLAQQLYQSQKTDALGRLTGGVAHDFNNMLGVILGTLEFVVDKVNDETLDPLLIRIRQAAERASDLTQRLLAFARQQPLNPRVVDVAALISDLSKLLGRTLGEAIDIRCFAPPALWKAEVDPSQLESALLNLSINARDAMPNGGKLTIEASNVALDDAYAENNYDVTPGDYVLISVSDSGTGMTSAVITKAFEPFFTTKDVGKGRGLGLSMVQGFIIQSQGHVKIYSELGHGTIVKLYIPRATLDAEQHEHAVEVTLERGDETILVVEDDEMMRDTAVLLLESLGYKVLVANSGIEALPIVESDQHIDLLFTDIVMPGGLDGVALAARARVRRPDFKIIFSSGYTDHAIIHQGRLPVGTDLVQKPYRRVDLAKKIRDVLDAV